MFSWQVSLFICILTSIFSNADDCSSLQPLVFTQRRALRLSSMSPAYPGVVQAVENATV
jgi:hypothetical protein